MAHDLREVLRPVSQFGHDWMHATMANGCLTLVLYLTLRALLQEGLPVWQLLSLGCVYIYIYICVCIYDTYISI